MSKIIAVVRSIIFWFVCALVVIISRFFIPIIVFICHADEKLVTHHARRIWAKISLLAGGLRIKIEGLANIPNHQPVILVSNHQSYLDIFVLSSIIPFFFRFLAWDDLFKIPIFGPLMRKSGSIPVSDNNEQEAFKSLLKVTKLVKAGESFVIFPEGRLTRDGNLSPFGLGTAVIALNTGNPVIPVAVSGSYKILHKGEWILQPGEIKIKFGKPLTFQNYQLEKSTYERATEKIRNSIEELLSSVK